MRTTNLSDEERVMIKIIYVRRLLFR